MSTTLPIAPDEMLALLNSTEKRPVACANPLRAQLLGMFDKLDARGQQAVIACAVFHLRYPQEKS
jgi:hypothetical protein